MILLKKLKIKMRIDVNEFLIALIVDWLDCLLLDCLLLDYLLLDYLLLDCLLLIAIFVVFFILILFTFYTVQESENLCPTII